MYLFFGLVAVSFVLAIPVLALVALVRASGNQRRVGQLETEVARLRVAIDALRTRESAARSDPEAEPAPEEATPGEPPERSEEPRPGSAHPPPHPSTMPSEPSAAAADPSITPPLELKPPEAKPVAAYSASMDGVETTRPEPRPEPQGSPPSPPPLPPSWSERLQAFDWENLIGVKLFSWIAGIALGLAGVFFLKYSFEQGLLQPPVRMAIGMIAGIGLLALCELRIASQYRVTANALDAAGVAILYATLFSSNAIWHLLPASVTFALMILVTVVAVGLSIRRESVFIALLGLIGGFATPAMLSSGEDHPITLFSYLLILNAGLAWVAYRKRWPVLAVLALLFTTLYQWGWVVKFLGTSNLPLAVSVFLAFPLLSVGAFFFASKRDEESSGSNLFGRSAAVASIVPVTFAIYLAAVPAYGERHHLLFAFLLLVDLGLLVIAATKRAPETLHAVGAISTVLVVAIWSGVSYSAGAWPSVLAWISALVLLYLAAPFALRTIGRRFAINTFEGVGARALWAAPLLLFVFPVLVLIEPATRSPWLLFGTLFVLVAATGFAAARMAMPGLYHLAALLAILAEVVWSAKHLGEETLLQGLIVYAAFALLFIAVSVWTRISERSIAIDGAPQLLASFILLFLLAGGAVANLALPGIALLIVILMAGLYIHRSSTAAIVAGIFLSWLVLQTWWSAATLAVNLIPALIVLAGLSLLILIGGWWLQRGDEGRAASWNVYLALVGHLFLLFTASRAELAVPPWPIFAVLALLALAIAAASHRLNSGGLFVADLVATQAVLIAWAATVRSGSWAAIAVVATLVTAAFGLAWRVISGRSGKWDETGRTRLAQGAFAGLFLGQIVMIVATRPESPGFLLVLFAHLALMAALLALAAQTRWHIAAVLAVAPASVAMALYRDGYVAEYWAREMILATALYLGFVLYPLAIGRRAGKGLEPYLAPILMSATYFFFAREGMLLRGLDDVIGVLPLAQAAVVAGLLVYLLRIEPRGERVMGRLALVAGVALAFVTVAIPLQLEKEWVTIGWALEGAALVWLFRRIQHRGLLWWSGGLLAIVFLRLTFNPAVLSYHARSETAILNWYLYTYVVAAAALFIAARLLPSEESAFVRRFRAGALTAGTILLFLLLNIEIADFFSKGPTITFNFSAGLAQDLTYTLGWALFAIALLVAGLAARNRPARMAAIGLLLVSVLKGFLRDLMSLGGLYRIASLVGLAIALAVVAVLLQKFVLSTRPIEEVEPA